MSPFASQVLEELSRSPTTTLSFFAARDLPAIERIVGGPRGPRESLEAMPHVHRYWLVIFGLAVKSSEALAGLSVLDELGERVAKAHDTYTPGATTPVLESTFTTWWTLDLPCGPERETFASLLSEIAPALGAQPWLTSAFRTLAQSRLGVYRAAAIGSDRVQLTELVTERTFHVVLADEQAWRAPLWLARVLPPPDDAPGDSALLGPHYELSAHEIGWGNYFSEHVLNGVAQSEHGAALASHFKALDHSDRWLDYMLHAYEGQNPATLANVLGATPGHRWRPKPSNAPLPQLVNTSGDALLLSTARYAVSDLLAARRALDAWLGKASGDGPWQILEGDAVHARLELRGDELRVECTSQKRLDAAKAGVKDRLGAVVQHRLDDHADPTVLLDEPPPARSPKHAPPPHEFLAKLQEHASARLRALLDEPNPILDGMTPRQAVETAGGRAAVIRMLARQQRLLEQGDMSWVDLSEIWATLGLVRLENTETRRLNRLLSGGKLSGPEKDDIQDRVWALLEREGVIEPTVLELSCTPGTLSACPTSATLVFTAAGSRAANFLNAYAEPLGHDAEPVFYFSEEDGFPLLEPPAAGARTTEHRVPVSKAHRPGRYRIHAFLGDGDLGREEMVAGCKGIPGIAARVRVEIVIVE